MPASRIAPWRFLRDVHRQGFLDAASAHWRAQGDAFQVSLGRTPLLFLMHPDAVEHVNLSHRDGYGKLGSYARVRRYLIGDGLVVSSGDLWRRQRKLMAPMFTPRGVLAYAGTILSDAERLASAWEGLADSGELVDVSDEMTVVTASIILRSMFGTVSTDSLDALKDAVAEMIEFSTRIVGASAPLAVPTPGNRRYLRARALVHRTLTSIIARRRAADPAAWPDDLLARMMRARDPDSGQAMSDDLLRDESITIFFAGHETTARTMSFVWLALAREPEVAARLHAELDEVIGDRPPTASDLHRLPYSLAVVKEVLRLYPAAPFYARDAITDDVVAGVEVRAGTTVMLSPYLTHRHPDFWSEPERFEPSRWLTERETLRHRHQYHPFAAGPRVCIGNSFSLLESQLLLAVLARRFAPRLAPSAQPMWHMRGTLTFIGGLPMVIARR